MGQGGGNESGASSAGGGSRECPRIQPPQKRDRRNGFVVVGERESGSGEEDVAKTGYEEKARTEADDDFDMRRHLSDHV